MQQLTKERFESLGVLVPDILLPNKDVDISRWAVVACDQYTSEPAYWQEINDYIGDAPSTLHITFPEVYLERETEAQKDNRILAINRQMQNYLDSDLFELCPSTLILTERTGHSGTRHGLMMAVDLEKYDFSKSSQSLIRATEGTIIDRLPPRIRIREHAALETPHIMLLVDDPKHTVIEPLLTLKSSQTAYDIELMKDGGHLRGWKITEDVQLAQIADALSQLAQTETFQEKYAAPNTAGVLLFAVGDGNHSLATAKSCWEKKKTMLTPDEQKTHPARYALVELVNVHDDGLRFEPIHRVVFHVDVDQMLAEFVDYWKQLGVTVEILDAAPSTSDEKSQVIRFITNDRDGALVLKNPIRQLDVGSLQEFLDAYLKTCPSAGIDYVHGEEITQKLGSEPGNIGFFLNPMNKADLFRTVVHDGALPRKTFSMGEAHEKRFYLECRRITI